MKLLTVKVVWKNADKYVSSCRESILLHTEEKNNWTIKIIDNTIDKEIELKYEANEALFSSHDDLAKAAAVARWMLWFIRKDIEVDMWIIVEAFYS